MEIVWQAEDSLHEKKVESELKDLLKTLLAFANSVAPSDTAKIFMGEKDDGTVQGVTNAESINQSVAKEAEKIYPLFTIVRNSPCGDVRATRKKLVEP